eukprot:CAMPEP_0183309166 /NCGR_PEP_ID=MMETSP0160_2-20130417/24239_1 /TAXON_ID=2839 ORGANISM="Odontella Sinensis, Strain Grunow 1884" /NCGR_SAMPLE_ID=MMETSP0160_2 /ASSEMBLY_ACC=CAM_ASM_000250 /LENGTH=298 /DNA_ID=CAMNT_0025473141 /DNA_START=65 /DNA_END=961 /DNA_ORIENTATION=+
MTPLTKHLFAAVALCLIGAASSTSYLVSESPQILDHAGTGNLRANRILQRGPNKDNGPPGQDNRPPRQDKTTLFQKAGGQDEYGNGPPGSYKDPDQKKKMEAKEKRQREANDNESDASVESRAESERVAMAMVEAQETTAEGSVSDAGNVGESKGVENGGGGGKDKPKSPAKAKPPKPVGQPADPEEEPDSPVSNGKNDFKNAKPEELPEEMPNLVPETEPELPPEDSMTEPGSGDNSEPGMDGQDVIETIVEDDATGGMERGMGPDDIPEEDVEDVTAEVENALPSKGKGKGVGLTS